VGRAATGLGLPHHEKAIAGSPLELWAGSLARVSGQNELNSGRELLIERACRSQVCKLPTSLRGSRAASMTFLKTQGDRDNSKGMSFYWYA